MFKSGLGMMIIIMVSRVLGLFRSVAVAYYFGAGEFTDAYYSAFKISNFFRQLLGEGALGNSFIPIYNEKVTHDGEEEGKKFIFSVLNLVFIFSSLVTILTIVFSNQIIALTVQGFSLETKELASKLLKIMSSYFLFISLSGMICAVLNNFKQFLVPASTGIFFNIAVIGSTIIAGRTHGITALGYGVVVAGLFQLLVVLPAFFKIVKSYSFKIQWKDPYLLKIGIMIVPMLFGIVARQLNTVVDQYFASFLDTGGVTALENATRLYNLPIGVFGISISTVIFPILSKAMVNKEFSVVRENFAKGINILLFLVVPSMVIFTVYSMDIVKLTLSYGKFSENDARVTADSLFYYSLGLYFYTAIQLATRGFYGVKDSKTPVKYSAISIGINIFLNAILIHSMKYKGLALATSVASAVNFFCLMYVFNKKYCKLDIKSSLIFLFKTIVTSILAVMASYFIENSIVKLIIFSLAYILLWIYPFYKKKMDVFYDKLKD